MNYRKYAILSSVSFMVFVALTFLIFFIAGKTSYTVAIAEIVPFLVYMWITGKIELAYAKQRNKMS